MAKLFRVYNMAFRQESLSTHRQNNSSMPGKRFMLSTLDIRVFHYNCHK